jgi:hypothetical protein
MTELSIKCAECLRSIPKSKKITINKSFWSAKEGDNTKSLDVCFSCYRNDKMREIRLGRYMIIIFILLGIFTYIIRFELIFISGAPDWDLQGLPTTEEPYIIIAIIFLALGGFFFLVQRRLKYKLSRMRILYES